MDKNQLRIYLRPVLTWWWLIVAASFIAAATCFVYVRLQPAIYQSQATLVVGRGIQDSNPDNTQLQVGGYLARTYAEIAQRNTVQDAVKAALAMEWLPEVEIVARPETQMIEISVVDNDPQRAQVVAGEYVNQIVLLSPGSREGDARSRFVQEQLDNLQTDITATEQTIMERRDELARATSARQIVSAEQEIAALETKLTSLRNNYASLLSSTQQGAVNAINILEPASLPERPVSDNSLILVALAGVLGAALAAAGAYMLDFLDDSITTVQQVDEQLRVTTLGSIPYLQTTDEPGAELVMIKDPHSVVAEAYRVLRANLQFASVDHPLHVLQVTSAAPGDGKTKISANLAIAMAQTGRRVILVDGDLRRPMQHRVFSLVNNVGLTTALVQNGTEPKAALQQTQVASLRVMTTGPLPPNPAELLGSQRMSHLIATLKADCDILVLDSPPATLVADTAVLAAQADGVLVVMWSGRTRREQTRHALTVLKNAHARVLGLVLNGTNRNAEGYYYNYDEAGYGGYYSPLAEQAHKQPKAEPLKKEMELSGAEVKSNGRQEHELVPPAKPGAQPKNLRLVEKRRPRRTTNS